MRMRRWIPSFVIAFVIGLGFGASARAERKVDWSEYLEPPGPARPLKHESVASVQPARAAPRATKASRTKASKAAKRRGAASRSKAKRKSSRGKRRR